MRRRNSARKAAATVKLRYNGGLPHRDDFMNLTNRKVVLDCESFETTLKSLAHIFQTTPRKMHEVLSTKEIGTYYETHSRVLPDFRDHLSAEAERHFGIPLTLDFVCWFHTTRILPGTTFSEGILPLGDARPSLKQRLIAAVDNVHIREQLRQALETDAIDDSHYADKTQDSFDWGPYAILVREVAFHAKELCQHDYLGMPEIIEDICSGFRKTSGLDLFDFFSAKLRPAIVKFTSTCNYDESCIATALYYAYSTIHDGAPSSNSVDYFNGENTPIPPQNILSVEFVELR